MPENLFIDPDSESILYEDPQGFVLGYRNQVGDIYVKYF